jgi:RNA polymerase sigma factor (sigma-70 family)
MIVIDKQFIKEYNKHIKNRLKKLGGHKDDIPDLVQDVYEKALLYQDYYEEKWGSCMKTYLYFIALHCVNRKYRGNDIMNDYVSLDTCTKINGEDIPMYETVVKEPDDEADSFYLSNTDEVRFYLDRIKESQRKVLELKLILGYNHKEIAETLQISEGNSRLLYKRGLDQFKQLVTGEEIELLQHKFKGIHQQSIQSNDETGVDVWNDWSFRPHTNGEVKEFTQEEIDKYLKGEE